jgi:hypothetical protein
MLSIYHMCFELTDSVFSDIYRAFDLNTGTILLQMFMCINEIYDIITFA